MGLSEPDWACSQELQGRLDRKGATEQKIICARSFQLVQIQREGVVPPEEERIFVVSKI